MGRQSTLTAINSFLSDTLTDLNYTTVSKDSGIFERRVSDETSCAVTIDARYSKYGTLEIAVMLSLMSDTLLNIGAELAPLIFKTQYIMPVLHVPLGYLCPEKKFQVWAINEPQEYETVCREVLFRITKYGHDWFETHSDLKSFYKPIKKKHNCNLNLHDFLMPICYITQGKKKTAVRAANKYLKQITKRPHGPKEIEQFSEFIRKLENYSYQI